MNQSTDTIFAQLLQAEEDQLYSELAIRAQASSRDPLVASQFTSSATAEDVRTMGFLSDLKDFGKRLFERLQLEAYKLFCGGDETDKQSRDALTQSLGLGDTAIVATVTSILVGSLGLSPAIAVVVSVIVVKRFLQGTIETTCAVWKEKLPNAAPTKS
jgi:hypothetical protein